MRPIELDSLFRPVENLPGIGPKLAEALARVTGREDADDTRVVDLLLLPPYNLIDRSKNPGIAHSPEGVIVTLTVRVDRHQAAPRGRSNVPHRVFVHDETGEMAMGGGGVRGGTPLRFGHQCTDLARPGRSWYR